MMRVEYHHQRQRGRGSAKIEDGPGGPEEGRRAERYGERRRRRKGEGVLNVECCERRFYGSQRSETRKQPHRADTQRGTTQQSEAQSHSQSQSQQKSHTHVTLLSAKGIKAPARTSASQPARQQPKENQNFSRKNANCSSVQLAWIYKWRARMCVCVCVCVCDFEFPRQSSSKTRLGRRTYQFAYFKRATEMLFFNWLQSHAHHLRDCNFI